jgi:hypothetical protein
MGNFVARLSQSGRRDEARETFLDFELCIASNCLSSIALRQPGKAAVPHPYLINYGVPGTQVGRPRNPIHRRRVAAGDAKRCPSHSVPYVVQ